MELEGNKELIVMEQPRRTWRVASASLPLAVFTRFGGRLGPKMAVWARNAQFWEGTSSLGAPALGRHR